MKYIFTLALGMMLWAMPAHATNSFWIGPTATGTGDCSSAANRCTFATANSSATIGTVGNCTAADSLITIGGAGSCVHAAAGTYNIGSELVLTKAGLNATQRHVWMCDAKWQCLIRQSAGGSSIVLYDAGAQSVVAGFDVTSTLTTVDTGTYLMDGNAANISFIGNHPHDGALGPCSDNGGAGITNSASGSAITAIGNLVENIGGPNRQGNCRFIHGIYFNSTNNVIQNNIVHGSPAFGVTCRHLCSGSVISGNTLYNNGGFGFGNQPASGSPPICCASGSRSGVGGGILIGNDSGHQTTTTVTNNIAYNNGARDGAPAGYACGIWDFANTDSSRTTLSSLVANNIIWGPQTGNNLGTPCTNGTGGTGNQVSSFGSTTTISNNSFVNPALVNYQPDGTGNYAPSASSLAVGAGTNSCTSGGITPCAPTVDFAFNSRPSPPSIGALEPSGTGTGTPQASPTSIAFGNILANGGGTSCSNPQTVTLSNGGTSSFNVTQVFTFNDPTFTFAPGGTCSVGQTLTAGQSCTTIAKFCPTTVGAKSANLTLFTSAGNVIVPLTGTGTSGALAFSATTVNFGSQQVGTTSAIQSVTATNIGTAAVSISSIAFGSGDTTEFTQASNCPSSLASNASCVLSFTFRPTSAGAKTVALVLTDTASNSPQTITLNGTGTGTPTPTLSPSSLSFGNQLVGSSSASQVATLTNNGTAPLTINSIQATGDFFLSATSATFITNLDDFPDAGGVASCSSSNWCWEHDTGTPGSSSGTSSLVALPSLDGQSRRLGTTWSGFGGTRFHLYLGPSHLDTASLNLRWDTWFYGVLDQLDQVEFDLNQTLSNGNTVIFGTQCNMSNGLVQYTTNVASAAHWNDSTIPCTHAIMTSNTWHHLVVTAHRDAAGVVTYDTWSLDGTLSAFSGATGNSAFSLGFLPLGNLLLNYQLNGNNTSNSTNVYIDEMQVVTAAGGMCSSPLAVSAACNFNVTFAPSVAGARSGTLLANTNAAGSPTTIPLTGTGTQGSITLAPASLTFAGQNTSTTSPSQIITISNPGTATVTLSSVALTGTNAGDFGLVNGCGGSLTAGASCTATITFTPTATGARVAQLTVTDTAPNSPHTANLTGTGTAPVASLTPVSIAFGNQITGLISSVQNLTLTNNGTGTMTIASIALTGANANQFSQTNTCGSTLAVAASCIIGIRFAPTSNGAKSASLTVTDNAAGSPHSSTLSGTGISGAPVASLTPSTMTFPTTLIGVSSATQTATLTNNGTTALTLTSITASGDFSQTNNCVSPIAIAASCQIVVKFTPTAAGARTGTLSVVDNASGSPHTVSLSGTGQTSGGGGSGIAVISPSSLTFSSQVTGTSSAAQTVTLQNTDTSTMVVNSITFTGNPTDYSETDNCVPALGAGATCFVQVTFTPIAVGARPASMVFTDSASTSPQSVTITGTGISPFPIVQVTPASLNFGSIQQASTTPSQTIVVKNVGTAVLNISAVTKTGTNAADYGLTNGCGATLAVNATCNLSVNFTPSGLGNRSASVSIASDDPTTPKLVPLTGTGTAAPAPTVTLSASSLSFALTAVGTTTATQTVTVTNVGDGILTISSITLGAPNATDFVLVSGCGGTLAPAANCILTLSFKPIAAGVRNSNVRLVDDASDSPQSFTLTGTGFVGAPTADLSVSTLLYLSQTILTTSAQQTIALTNNGNAALAIASITATSDLAPASSEYAQTNNCGSSLLAGGSCVINVTFTPQAPGARTGKVTVVDNAAGPSQVVTLLGTGVNPAPPPGNSAAGIGGRAGSGGKAGTGVH